MTTKKQTQQEIFLNKAKIDSVFLAQTQNRWKVAQTTASERIEKIKKIEGWILDNRQAIRDALFNDLKKPPLETDITEIAVSLLEVRHIRRNLRRWMRPKGVRPTPLYITTRSSIISEPRGVVLIISPWNYSINLVFAPLAAAIAAGNCVMLKPSEFSPHSSSLIQQAMTELFPEDEVAIFTGDKEVAIELLKKPFDHIFFTGSTETGQKVMEAASKNLSSITLELGGKSPVIIDESANIKDAAQKIVWTKILNCGQSCHAPDYLLVHDRVQKDLVEHLILYIKKLLGETSVTRENSKNYARIIDSRHFNRLKKLLDSTVAEGAKVEIGGTYKEKEYFIDLTVLSCVPFDSSIMTEEIFGPLLPILAVPNIDDAIRYINSKPKPLALYVFSKNKQVVKQVLGSTSAGTTCVNDIYIQYSQTNLPFGGVNASGMGRTHGFHGFQTFSNEKAVLRHHRFSPFKFLYPPYTKRVQKIRDIMLKYL